MSVWVHLIWDPLCFLYLDICFLLQVWDVFSHNFIKDMFNPLLSLLLLLGYLMLSQWSLKLFPLRKMFFSFCCSDCVLSIILSSSWLMCSSISSCLLFIPFNVLFFHLSYCILQFWLDLFILSSSLLKVSLCSSILFPNSVCIPISNALNSLSSKLFITVSLVLFFKGDSLAPSVEANSSVLFCLSSLYEIR